jgi:hypothetical protein
MATIAEQLTEAQAKVAEYMAAETAALEAQEIRLTSAGGIDRAEVMADLTQIRRGLTMWRSRLVSLQAQLNGQPTFAGMPFTSARFGDYTS